MGKQAAIYSKKLEALSRKLKRDYWCSASLRLKDAREMLVQIHIGRRNNLGCIVCEWWQLEKAPAQKTWTTCTCTGFPVFSLFICPGSGPLAHATHVLGVYLPLSAHPGAMCLWKQPHRHIKSALYPYLSAQSGWQPRLTTTETNGINNIGSWSV